MKMTIYKQAIRTFAVLLVILLPVCLYAQTIQPGDNINTEFKKIGKPYYFEAPAFTSWAEGSHMFLIGAKPDPNECDFLFIALQDSTLIGVFKVAKPNSFMFDTAGNAILGNPSNFFLLPLWTVKNKTTITAADKTILTVLDKMYEQTMQANNGQLDEKTTRKYQQFISDTRLPNRHIALLFDNYQNIISETAGKGEIAPASVCIPLMKTLAGECLSLYQLIPPIVCIYMGEALQSAGMLEEARSHFKISLQFYPGSIPLLVYNYKLEPDQAKKSEMLVELKKKFSKHWMVKDL